MSRYQVYLNPQSVAVVDEWAGSLDLTRSHIIRDVLDRVVGEYLKARTAVQNYSLKHHPLLKMSGIIHGASHNLSESVDTIYSGD